MRIQWYWAAEDAPYYPYPHAFEPILFLEDKVPLEEGVGELPGAARNYNKGQRPKGVHASGHWCGTEADFRGQGVQPLLPTGKVDFNKLCGCAYQPKIGFRIKSQLRKRFEFALSGDIAFNGKNGVGVSDTVSFAGDLVYMASATVATETVSEIEATLALASVGGCVASTTATTAGTIAFNATGAVAASTTATTAGTIAFNATGAVAASTTATTAGTLALETICSATGSSSTTTAGTIAFNGRAGSLLGSPGAVLGNLVWNAAGNAAGADSPTTGGTIGFNGVAGAGGIDSTTTAGTLGFGQPTTPTTYLLDNFVDTPLTALTSHTPDVGGPWVYVRGQPFTIDSSGAYCSFGTNDQTVADVGVSDYTIEASVEASGGGKSFSDPCIIFRFVDQNNTLYCRPSLSGPRMELRKIQGGTDTQVAVFTVAMTALTVYPLKIVCSGTSISFYWNGSFVATMTNSFNATATKVGLILFSGEPTPNAHWRSIYVHP